MNGTAGKVGAALVLLLLAAFGLRPGRESHEAAVRARCQDAAGAVGQLGCGAMLGAGGAFGAVKYDDYYLFTRLSVMGKPVSDGAFGYVHVR